MLLRPGVDQRSNHVNDDVDEEMADDSGLQAARTVQLAEYQAGDEQDEIGSEEYQVGNASAR